MNWIRFDAQRPPEDTTVMVSNGPAMGHYHYVENQYFSDLGGHALDPNKGVSKLIPLWTLDGKRADVPLSSVIQWAHMLPVKAREIKKLSRWQSLTELKAKTWNRVKAWFN